MRIGIDYLPALVHPPGVGRYVRELVRALVQLEDRPDLGLFEVGSGERIVDPRSLGLSIGDPRTQRVESHVPRRLLRLARKVGGRGADGWLGGVDIFHHALPLALPVSSALQTIAISELPETKPGDADAERAEECLRACLERMDCVFTFSDSARSLVIQRFALAPAKVVRVHVGCEHWRRGMATIGPRALPPRILVLGRVRASRRPLVVLRAFERLCETGLDARLEFRDLPGTSADAAALALEDALRTSKVSDKVFWTRPSDARAHRIEPDRAALEREMPERVAAASILVHLSDQELTPITPLEALSVGVPVVASRIPAFEEALSGVAELVDDEECQREPDVLCAAIQSALQSSEDGQAVARRAVVARAFTWERCAKETLAAWRELLGPDPDRAGRAHVSKASIR